MKFLLTYLFNAQIRALVAKYGFSVVKQLVKVGARYAREKNEHREWTQADRHAYLAAQLRKMDLVPETTLDEEAIDILVTYFLGPKPERQG